MKTISVYRVLPATLFVVLYAVFYCTYAAPVAQGVDNALAIPNTTDTNPIVRAPDEIKVTLDLDDDELTPAQIEAQEQRTQIQPNDTLEAPSDFVPTPPSTKITPDTAQATSLHTTENVTAESTTIRHTDKLFIDALNTYRARDFNALESIWTQSREHPLSDYIELWMLLLRADKNYADSETRNSLLRFIRLHDGEYISERARTDYARIAAKNEDSKMFARLYQGMHWNRSESDIACYNKLFELQAARKKNSLSSAKRMLVQTSAPTDNACKLLSATVRKQDPSWAWINALILMQQKRFSYAKSILKDMPSKQLKISKNEAFTLLDNPQKWLRLNRSKLKKKPARLLVLAVLRLAAIDPESAARVAQIIHPKLSAQIRAIIWGRIGYEAALDQASQTLSWYAKAGSLLGKGPFTVAGDEVLLWQAREALRSASPSAQLKAISKLPPHLRQSNTWMYWRARALQKTGKQKNARNLLTAVSHGHGFYALLARDALGLSYLPVEHRASLPNSTQRINRFKTNASLQRALRFYELDMIYEGNREWNWAMRNMKKKDRIELAEYAQTIGITHRQINTAASAGGQINLPLLYPQTFAKEIHAAAKAANLPQAWVYGLIRQESRFVRTAKSSVGAKGLMQIMPKTGRWVAKKIALDNYNDNHLVQLQTNLLIGSQYLKLVADSFDGNVVLATAAYNAGQLRSQMWRSTLKHPIDAAAFIETIPFGETRNYVAKVTTNTVYYSLYGDQPLRLSDLLGTISPKPIDKTQLP